MSSIQRFYPDEIVYYCINCGNIVMGKCISVIKNPFNFTGMCQIKPLEIVKVVKPEITIDTLYEVYYIDPMYLCKSYAEAEELWVKIRG